MASPVRSPSPEVILVDSSPPSSPRQYAQSSPAPQQLSRLNIDLEQALIPENLQLLAPDMTVAERLAVIDDWSKWCTNVVGQIFDNTVSHDMPNTVVAEKHARFMSWKVKELNLAKAETAIPMSEAAFEKWQVEELSNATDKLDTELEKAIDEARSGNTTLNKELRGKMVMQYIEKHGLALQIGEHEAFRHLIDVDKALAQDFLHTFNRIQAQRASELKAVIDKVRQHLIEQFSKHYEFKNEVWMAKAEVALNELCGKAALERLSKKIQLAISLNAAMRAAHTNLEAPVKTLQRQIESIKTQQLQTQPKAMPEATDPFFAAARGPSPSGWVGYVLQWNQQNSWDNEGDVFVLDHSNSALPKGSGLYLNTNNDIVVWVESPPTGVRITLVDRRDVQAHDTVDGFRWASIAGRLVQLSNRQHRRNATVWMIRRRTNAFPEDLARRVTRIAIGD